MIMLGEMTTLVELGSFDDNWDHTGRTGRNDRIGRTGTVLVELGWHWLNWDHSMTAGTILGELGYDHTGRTGTVLVELGHFCLNWDGTG